jgi:hypothetical protein
MIVFPVSLLRSEVPFASGGNDDNALTHGCDCVMVERGSVGALHCDNFFFTPLVSSRPLTTS